jgi:hypothetical protein
MVAPSPLSRFSAPFAPEHPSSLSGNTVGMAETGIRYCKRARLSNIKQPFIKAKKNEFGNHDLCEV